MPTLDQATVLQALSRIIDPDLRRDIVTLGFVKNVAIDGGRVSFTIELTTPACPVKDQMRDQALALVGALPGVTEVASDDSGRPHGGPRGTRGRGAGRQRTSSRWAPARAASGRRRWR
jgi:metal-sulfur cluster biosynthetic enzyme